VLVNFWASWCVTCKEEAGYLEEAWRYYQPGGEVVFLGVAWTDTDSKAMEYLKYYDITYTNGPDLGTRIAHRYRITGVPETFIIDRKGTLATVHLIPFASTAEVLSKIDPLLQP
jgi:cytochrome c biogenesis protein CcmG/thiol:disulfide interchange protein DsbE